MDTAKVILLKGNPKNPESAEHIIKFPGGSISVCRTSNNEYWAHIEVNNQTDQIYSEMVRESAFGEIVESRLDYKQPPKERLKILTTDLYHLAIKIKTSTEVK